MNFTTYLETVRVRAAPLDHQQEIFHAKLGMVTEAGELCNVWKRVVVGKAFDPLSVLDECGDWFWYFCLYCDRVGWPMVALETKAHDLSQDFVLDREQSQAPGKIALTVASSTAAFCDAEMLGMSLAEAHEMADAAFSLVVWLLLRHGFTVEQCLEANDAKLEKRTGKAFSLAFFERDREAEREILEGHAKQN